MTVYAVALSGSLLIIALLTGLFWWVFRKDPLWMRITGSIIFLIVSLTILNADFHFIQF